MSAEIINSCQVSSLHEERVLADLWHHFSSCTSFVQKNYSWDKQHLVWHVVVSISVSWCTYVFIPTSASGRPCLDQPMPSQLYMTWACRDVVPVSMYWTIGTSCAMTRHNDLPYPGQVLSEIWSQYFDSFSAFSGRTQFSTLLCPLSTQYNNSIPY